jgi:DNA polymerase III alpha subunit (gram-positive type)
MESRIQDYLVIDVETGGLTNKDNIAFYDIALVEVAMVYLSPDLKILDKASFLLKPYTVKGVSPSYNGEAFEITNLTMDMLENEGVSIVDGIEIIKQFISTNLTSNKKPVMVGHKIDKFDGDFFINMFKSEKDNIFKIVQDTFIDTLTMSHWRYPQSVDYKLSTMCDLLDIELVNAHRALPDTIATAELFIEYMKGFRGKGISLQSDDIVIPEYDTFQF